MSDLISRQALRDAMYHEAFETDTEMQRWDSGCWIRYKLFENVIDNLPPAERKRGEWIYKSMKGQFCSVCDMQSVWKYNYCPNCGADMRGDEDE